MPQGMASAYQRNRRIEGTGWCRTSSAQQAAVAAPIYGRASSRGGSKGSGSTARVNPAARATAILVRSTRDAPGRPARSASAAASRRRWPSATRSVVVQVVK